MITANYHHSQLRRAAATWNKVEHREDQVLETRGSKMEEKL